MLTAEKLDAFCCFIMVPLLQNLPSSRQPFLTVTRLFQLLKMLPVMCLASVQADHGGMQCIQAMPAGVGQWVWVSDFKGFGMSDCDPRLAKVFLDLSAAHYPERLGLFLVIDAPWSAPFFCPSFVVLHT